MQTSCKKCGTVTSIENEFEAKSFGCSHCNSLFTFEGELKTERQFDYRPINPILEVGAKGIIDGVEYEIINRLIKKFHAVYYWREYTLKSKDDKYLYLSESDGHWILLEEISESYDTSRRYTTLTYKDLTYDLYENTKCAVVAAAGFFDYVVPNGNIQIIEYINPPNIVSIEKYGDTETTYFGRHFTTKEVKKAFGNPNLPVKSGVGAVQPYLFNFHNTAIIFCCIAILVLITQLVVNNNRVETEVLSKNFSFTEYNNKDFVSESFTLKGASAPLTISINSEVDNSWANAQIALVNEVTNEEEYANKDIEYYHGYTDGENWSEGGRSEEFNICGVGEGKYHLVITPQKQPDDTLNNRITVKAVWQAPSLWNFFISILIMGIALAAVFFMNKHFENRRWESSDFSPF